MYIILNVIGWLLLVSGGFNAAIKIFAADDAMRALAGPSRDLDLNIYMGLAALGLLALAKILGKLEELEEKLGKVNN